MKISLVTFTDTSIETAAFTSTVLAKKSLEASYVNDTLNVVRINGKVVAKLTTVNVFHEVVHL